MAKTAKAGPEFVCVSIPTTSGFLKQWHPWVQWKVNQLFKRDKERVPDVAQRVRLRLLSKDFVARWFFKHLTNDLVDLPEARRILGGAPITYIGQISPVYGKRSSPSSLWRISDLLKFAKFDYARFFYSPQGHTIDSKRVLRLLGYGKDDGNGGWEVDYKDYGALESLYRQGKLKPSELTEHDCVEHRSSASPVNGKCAICGGKHYSRGYCSAHYHLSMSVKCQECIRGREILNEAGISLAHRWSDPTVALAVSKLRWNDNQLTPFLREWRKTNMVKSPPLYIMRTPPDDSIDAGLKKYAHTIITNDVINSFKSMGRNDDLSKVVLDTRLDPEASNADSVAREMSDDEESSVLVIKDRRAAEEIRNVEIRHDAIRIIGDAHLTDEEALVFEQVEMSDVAVKDVASSTGFPVSKVHRLRSSAIFKMKIAASAISISDGQDPPESHNLGDIESEFGRLEYIMTRRLLTKAESIRYNELLSEISESGVDFRAIPPVSHDLGRVDVLARLKWRESNGLLTKDEDSLMDDVWDELLEELPASVVHSIRPSEGTM